MNRKLEILPLIQDRFEDLTAVFETSDECKNCWCMNHRMAPEKVVTGGEARSCFQKSIGTESLSGLLAYVEGKPAGWCAVDPLRTQVGHDYYLSLKEPPSASTWIIHCLYVIPGARGLGVSTELVKGAVRLAREKGASEVLAFPIPEESHGKFPLHDAEFSGRMSTYLKQGFEKAERLNEFYQKVRLDLTS